MVPSRRVAGRVRLNGRLTTFKRRRGKEKRKKKGKRKKKRKRREKKIDKMRGRARFNADDTLGREY